MMSERNLKDETSVSTANNNNSVSFLLEVIGEHVFGFLGVGHYRYVAGTSRQWRDLYTHFLQQEYEKKKTREAANTHNNNDSLINPSTGGSLCACITTAASIVESVSRAKMWLEEEYGGDPLAPWKNKRNFDSWRLIGRSKPSITAIDGIGI